MTCWARVASRDHVMRAVKGGFCQALLDDLELTRGKTSWGVMFRRGLFAIEDDDYQRIAAAMKVSPEV